MMHLQSALGKFWDSEMWQWDGDKNASGRKIDES